MRSFLLITTADLLAEGRRQALDRLFSSVESYRGVDGALAVRMKLLLQRSSEAEAAAIAERHPWVEVEAIPGRVSLSAARNILLTAADLKSRSAEDLEATVVAFPDDDAWYAPGSMRAIAEAFATRSGLDFLFCRYGPEPECPAAPQLREPQLQTVISFASSNTLFLRGSTAAGLGGFDETLGVGGIVPGGEDTEYAIRAFYAARRRGYVDHRLVGHRAVDVRLKTRYYPGSLLAIARHAPKSLAGRLSLVRKLAVGLMHVLRRRLRPAEFADYVQRFVLAERRWLR